MVLLQKKTEKTMTKPGHRKSFFRKKKGWVFFVFVGALCFAIYGLLGSATKNETEDQPFSISLWIKDSSVYVLAFMESPGAFLTDFTNHTKRHKAIAKEAGILQELESDLSHLKNEQLSLVSENTELRRLLSLQGTAGKSEITVPCYGQHSAAKSGILFLHAGYPQSIQRYDPVMYDGALIGQVDAVSAQTSRVLLISDQKSKIAIFGGRSQKEGILTAAATGKLFLDYVKKPADFKMGEPIFTSGVDGYLPRGLLVGHVETVQNHKVYIAPKVGGSFQENAHADWLGRVNYVKIKRLHGHSLMSNEASDTRSLPKNSRDQKHQKADFEPAVSLKP